MSIPDSTIVCYSSKGNPLTASNMAFRARNLFIKAFGKDDYGNPVMPIFSITLEGHLEVHTVGWRSRLPLAGFIFLKEGYFSSIWEFPESALK